MATVDQSSGINGGTHPSRAIRKMPYKIETDVNQNSQRSSLS